MATNIKFKRTSTTTLPTGLTFAEPAFVLGAAGTTTVNQLYIGDNSGGRVWIGAQIENTVTSWTGTAANSLLATQQAIDARITSRITSSGGFTFQGSAGTAQTITPGDTVTFAAGSGISTVGSATDTITFTNIGVTSFNGLTGAVTGVGSFNGLTGAITGVSTFNGKTGTVTGVGSYNGYAGGAINVSYGAGICAGTPSIVDTDVSWIISNVGVLSFNGSTGAVTGVSTFNGFTGAVGITAGTGISINTGTKTAISITNIGVTSFNGSTGSVTGVSSFNGLTGTVTGVSSLTLTQGSGITFIGAGTTGSLSYTIINSGVTGVQAGTGISVSSNTGNPTISNTGVLSFNGSAGAVTGVGSFNGLTGTVVGVGGLTGTANQIAVSGTTGSITLSLPNAITTPGSLTVTGDLTVNGTTTTVNSTTVQVQDPIIAIGGYTGGAVPTVGDVKDRGIAFQWYSGAGATGFFGHDTSASAFTYIPSGAAIASEVVTGTPGKAIFGTVDIFSATGNATLQYSGSAATFTIPNHAGGTFLAPTNLGISNYILKSNGLTGQPSWQDSTTSGFTAFVSTNVSGGAQGSLPYQTAVNTTGMLSLGTSNFLLTAGTTAPQWTNPNAAGFTAFMATNVVGGAAGSLHIQSAANTTSMLALGTTNFILTAGSTGPQWTNPNAAGFTAFVATNVITTEQSGGTYYLAFTTAASNAAALSVDITATVPLSYNVTTGTLACAVIDALVDGGAY